MLKVISLFDLSDDIIQQIKNEKDVSIQDKYCLCFDVEIKPLFEKFSLSESDLEENEVYVQNLQDFLEDYYAQEEIKIDCGDFSYETSIDVEGSVECYLLDKYNEECGIPECNNSSILLKSNNWLNDLTMDFQLYLLEQTKNQTVDNIDRLIERVKAGKKIIE